MDIRSIPIAGETKRLDGPPRRYVGCAAFVTSDPVTPMVIVSVLLMWIVSLVTSPPSTTTIRRYEV